MTTIIAWDLGATKCTAGIVNHIPHPENFICEKKFTLKLTTVNSLINLIETIEEKLGIKMVEADAICIAAAGHYDGENLLHENVYPFAMNFAEVARKLNWQRFAIIHDYAPIVCATFTSYMHTETNIKRLNHCAMHSHGRRVAFGIGTGLGLKDGVLLPNGDFWLGRNEMGHIGVASPPATDTHLRKRHDEFIHFLISELHLKEQQPVTFEKILSGQGIARLYEFLYLKKLSPEEVGTQIKNNLTPELLDLFAWYIGLFIGTIQMTFMPEGGVWITGGVALHHPNVFERPDLQHGINASPAYRAQRETYPLGVLCNHEHALIGCGYYASRRLINNSPQLANK